MPRAGHGCSVKIVGTSVSTTDEATTCLDGGTYTKYRISTAARRVIDPSQTVTVKKNTVAQAATTYTIDYANGIVKFNSALLVGDAVTITYYYWPLLTIAETVEFSIRCMRTMLDKTSFDTSGARSRLAGLKDAEGTIRHLTLGSDDLDSGAGTRKLHDVLTDGTTVVLAFAFDGTAEGETFRVIGSLERIDDGGSVDGLIEETLAWKAGYGVNGSIGANTACLFGFDDGRHL